MSERIESVFTSAEVADMRARYEAEKQVRAAQVRTEAGLQLLHVSRTVIDRDRHTLTVVDGDILDFIKAIESALLDERDAAIRRAEQFRDERDLARMQYAQVALAQDILRDLISGIETGYPLSDGSWEGDVVARAQAVLNAEWTIVPPRSHTDHAFTDTSGASSG